MKLTYEYDRCWTNEDYKGHYVIVEGEGARAWFGYVRNLKTREVTNFHASGRGAKPLLRKWVEDFIDTGNRENAKKPNR